VATLKLNPELETNDRAEEQRQEVGLDQRGNQQILEIFYSRKPVVKRISTNVTRAAFVPSTFLEGKERQ